MPDTEEKTYTPEQMEFAHQLAKRIEQLPVERRPTMRALLSAFVTGAEAMYSDHATSEHPEIPSGEHGASE